jgi:hypothetical protein
VPTWGDGSSTGTGGTFTVAEGPLNMWKGKWSPCVYQFSSNWKELEMLKLTLERLLKEEDPSLVQGTMVFYFTDNCMVYWIVALGLSGSPPLHALIKNIRVLKIWLGCHLQVVQVSGIVMISPRH